ncbi:cyclopropane-fatty-acyl-phospholipid synthase family protein [Paucisalibacillus sp. EB02]|uniref:SAM-dependent methyltransferase n=1 Tax=Paucisalibacillus sp. EB02 TaxID=1347087 RepID=UPI0004B53DEF|nr:class I SAM-dependent methyltransferase [Paucisalibacillus sp. EB02]
MKSLNINEKTATFIGKYDLFSDDKIQQVQLQHRLDLVDAFELKKGMSVLEIGCGQGDTTVALADAVGENGHVVAIDIASPEYGAPLTLGQATDILKQSELGQRITFHFGTDFAKYEVKKKFDVVVLSHSSWYFQQPEYLINYFKKIKQVANRICFAEWDLDFTRDSQRSHFCAATILSLYSSFVNNDGNIQNLFHKAQIRKLLMDAGFSIDKEQSVDASYLQDGYWEKDYANSIRTEFNQSPIRIQTLINSYYELMNQPGSHKESLNSIVIIAQ